ncbi:MAG: 30S ribosome-binding factor RbfA [Verrucomicrobiota bacterium]
MKHRLDRVKEVIKRELSEIIPREIAFKAALVTVQHVDITPDLKQCHVFISAIGTEGEKKAALTALENHRTLLQHSLSKRVVLKYTPQLHFKLDTAIERGTRVIEILDKIGLLDETLQPPPDAKKNEE